MDHLVLGGDGLLDDDVLARGQRGGLAGDEGAVLGPDHGQVGLSVLGPLFGGLQLSLEAAHAGQVGLRYRLLLSQEKGWGLEKIGN